MSRPERDHYATLGLDRGCTDTQIRDAYRILARQHHPDVNNGSAASLVQTQALNAAYEILGDPDRRQTYDRELHQAERSRRRGNRSSTSQNLAQDVLLRIDELLRGTTREIRINDPGREGAETYDLVVPPETAPGTKFRLDRHAGGVLTVRVKALPSFQFKVRGSDLKCDLMIKLDRATQGGEERVKGVDGQWVRIKVPARVERGAIIRIANEGLPKARGGRGDLLVRILYRPEVRISRGSNR